MFQFYKKSIGTENKQLLKFRLTSAVADPDFRLSSTLRENTDQKKLRIWTFFTQWQLGGVQVKR